jgi:hypothetical protein
MSEKATNGPILPNYRTARLVGTLNIVFAALLLVCGLGLGVSVASMPYVSQVFEQAQERIKKQAQDKKKADLEALDEQAKSATDPEEKKAIEEKRKEVEERPDVPANTVPDFTGFMKDPKLIGWYWVEIVTGIVLNVLLLVSGIGLLKFRGWGRVLGVRTGWLKILRLVVLYSYFSIAVVPEMARKMADMAGTMISQQAKATGGRGFGPAEINMLAKVYAITYSAYSVGMILVGVIYPALMIWYLTRPGVVAACRVPPSPARKRSDGPELELS